MRWLVAFLIEHQGVFFGVLGGLAGLLAVGLARLIQHLRADPTAGTLATGEGAGRWKVLLPFIGGAVIGAGLMYQWNPISETRHLEFPDLVCDHKGENLILFLHGWRGESAETWRLYPHLVCGDLQFSNSDVLSLGYPIYITQGNLTMKQLASWIAARLAANGVDRYKRIVIVAHSIGGLVARRLVLEKSKELASIGLIVELSTPHDGPEDYTALLSQIGVKGGKLIEEVKKGSNFLEGLKKDWQALPAAPVTYCLGGPQDWVVSYDSAVAGCAEKAPLPSYDHREIAKPQSRREDRYAIPVHRVRKYLADGA